MRTAESSPAVRARVGSVRTKGPVRITMGTLEWYLKKLERDGLKKTSIVSYRSALMKLYERLHDGVLDAAAIEDWEAWMQSRDLSPATLQMQKATLNGFLRYLDRPEWQMAVRPRGRRRKRVEKPQTPGLTRAEYLTLLKTARDMGRERAYLLIKTMGDAGINSMELSGVTIEALRTGRVQTERFNLRRAVTVPEPLRTELLDYAARSGVTAGPVFVTRDGDPILHPFVWREVKRVCRQTGISEEKGTPKNLRQLYLNTYKGVQAEHMDNTDAAYQRLLEYEERDVGWAV